MNTKTAGIIAAGFVAAAIIVGFVPRASSLGLTPTAGAPVAAGDLVSVHVLKYPVERSSNEGETFKEGRVEVHDRFIVVIHPKGQRSLHLHGWYTDLWFKSE